MLIGIDLGFFLVPIIKWAFFWYLWLVITWGIYIAVQELKERRKTLTGLAKVFGYTLLGIGLPMDWIFNMVIGTLVLFWEMPEEPYELFSARLQRWAPRKGYRGWLARGLCHNLLHPFDEDHCD